MRDPLNQELDDLREKARKYCEALYNIYRLDGSHDLMDAKDIVVRAMVDEWKDKA
jgi:hypothetical protein